MRNALSLRILVPVAYMAVLWFLSSLPEGEGGTLGGIWLPPLIQNSIHIPAFAILAAAWLWALNPGRPDTNAGLWAWALTMAYGVVDELHQGFVHGRTSSLGDLALDALGAGLVVVLASLTARKVVARPTHQQ